MQSAPRMKRTARRARVLRKPKTQAPHATHLRGRRTRQHPGRISGCPVATARPLQAPQSRKHTSMTAPSPPAATRTQPLSPAGGAPAAIPTGVARVPRRHRPRATRPALPRRIPQPAPSPFSGIRSHVLRHASASGAPRQSGRTHAEAGIRASPCSRGGPSVATHAERQTSRRSSSVAICMGTERPSGPASPANRT